MVIFHSYVSLPEGITTIFLWFSDDVPIKPPLLLVTSEAPQRRPTAPRGALGGEKNGGAGEAAPGGVKNGNSTGQWIGLRENLQETHGFLPSN